MDGSARGWSDAAKGAHDITGIESQVTGLLLKLQYPSLVFVAPQFHLCVDVSASRLNRTDVLAGSVLPPR
jgi:hypothetical protein